MVEVRFLSDEEFYSVKYRNFVKEFHQSRADRKIKQFEWYRQYKDYVTAIVVLDGSYAGQASAYACEVNIRGLRRTIYWGCDTFVLSRYRGHGFGKKLQKYLYDNIELFVSAGYSKINGIIKRKCGAVEVWGNTFCYYAVSNFVQFLISKCSLILFKKNIAHKISFFPIYALINKCFCQQFELWEERYDINENEITGFIEDVLKKSYDFYVVRDKEYMRWKYMENPTMTYHMLVSRKPDKTINAVVFVTDVYEYDLSGVKLKYSKVLDVFQSKSSNVSMKNIHMGIINYFLKKNIYLDGIASMFKFNWLGMISFRRSLLSTYNESNFKKAYISYSDQDLEQML